MSAPTQAIEKRGPQLLAAFSASVDSPWVDPIEGSVAAVLRDAQIYLASNDDDRAQTILIDLGERLESEGSSVEKAEFEYLHGKICSLRKESQETIARYEAAATLNPESSKYYAASIEAKFVVAFPDDIEAIRSLVAEMPEPEDESVLCVKARLQAAVGEIDAALDALSDRDSFRCLVARALILYLDKNWDSLIEICDIGLGKQAINPADQSLFHLLKARAFYYQGIGRAGSEVDGYMSPFGNADMKFETVWRAWEEARITLELFRASNWPANVEHIIDVVSVLSVALNQQHEVLGDLKDLSDRRPQFEFAHDVLHRLAVLSGDDTLALKALDRLPEDDETLHLRILALHGNGNHEKVVKLAEDGLLDADRDNELRGACLGTSALSAHAILRSDRAAPFEKALKDESGLEGDLAVFKYIHSVNDNPLSRAFSASEFYDAFLEFPLLRAIQDNLLPALDALNVDQAAKCIKVADRIIERRRLAIREVRHLAQAYVTLHNWSALERLADDSIVQYGPVPSLQSLKAVACEGMGNASGALQILEGILSESPNEEFAIESYITICARNGFHPEALQQLENLLQHATRTSQKVGYLQQMWGLQMAISPDSSRSLEIALRYGALCDVEVEEQEGVFLQMFIMSTLREDIEVNESQKKEFNARADKFFERFPNSDVFKRVELPTGQDGESLISTLNAALGFTPQAEQWFNRVENQLQNGEIAVPYCWLPRRFLRNIPDVPFLWAVGKTSSRDAHAYHLTISGDPEYKGAELHRGLNLVPLMDMTSLIVLHDLGLLDIAFRILCRVAIGKKSLAEIQRLSHPFFGGYKNITAISDFLKDHIDQIEQPGSPFDNEDPESKLDAPLEELKRLADTGRYSLYVDDLRALQYIGLNQAEAPYITTIDILNEAERRELLTTAQVSKMLAELIKFRVNIVVEGKYFLAAIPAEVAGIDDVDKLISILDSDDTYSSISAGLWDIRIDYKNTINHVAFHLSHIAQSHEAKVELLAAVWETWLAKVKFRTDLAYSGLEHAAYSLVLAATLAREDKVAVKRLWDAYILVAHLAHGKKMDESRESQARNLVGQVTARIAQEKEPEFRDAISNIMRIGLREGTAEFDQFSNAYEEERIRLATQESND